MDTYGVKFPEPKQAKPKKKLSRFAQPLAFLIACVVATWLFLQVLDAAAGVL
jgi:hypothetical protein